MTTACLVLALLSAAPEPSSAAASLPEQRALALELMALVHPEAAYRSGIEQMTAQMMPQLEAQARASGRTLPADFKTRFVAAMLEAVPYDETLEWGSEVYAQRFTVAELKELIAFYKSPLGQKVAAKVPEIMGEIGKRMATLLPQRMMPAMRKHGLIPERAAQPVPQPKPTPSNQ